MGTDCRIHLPNEAQIRDVADVIGVLLGKEPKLRTMQGGGLTVDVEGVGVASSSVIECAEIIIKDATWGADGKPGDRWFFYHFEYHDTPRRDAYTRCGRGIQPRCTAINIAMCVELAKFFGGTVDYNDCDSRDVNFRAPVAKDLLTCNGKKWENFQRRKAAVKPLTKEQIAKYQKYVR